MMMVKKVLCFLLGASIAATAASSGDPQPHYDTIVVGLGAAGVTAAATLAKGGRRVLGLEAQSRVGGRVHTVPFGNGVVELGAEWIHGTKNSVVYNLAKEHNITTRTQSSDMDLYRSDGGSVDRALMNELMAYYMDIMDQASSVAEPLGVALTRKLKEYIKEHKPELLTDEGFMTELLDFFNRATNLQDASNDWNDVTNVSGHQDLGGSTTESWHRNGYKTFFDIMLNTYNNGPGLPNLDIKMNKEVTYIDVPAQPDQKVVVTCQDGSIYVADTAIVTVSLGVLKSKFKSLFPRHIQANKLPAIEKLSMGTIGKIIFSFDEPWWPQNTTMVGFIWTGEDRKKVGQDDLWTTKVYGVSRPMGSSDTLTVWTSGDAAKKVENLPEEVVKSKCIELLQRFIGNTLKITVPQPSAMLRSTWYSNPFTQGAYSFDNLEAGKDARLVLGGPFAQSDGKERVLFAGEATSVNHYGTVHGASETGRREAEKLLK